MTHDDRSLKAEMSSKDHAVVDRAVDDRAVVDAVEEELVAYLDGELPADDVERIERRLADDQQFHARLLRLQKAWDMLDYLPKGEPSESFTRSTVEMVTQSLEQEATRIHRQRVHRGFWIAAGLACLSAVGGAIGFQIIRWRQEAPNRQLVKDLPVIENSDLYRNADSITFLERLAEEGLFENE